MLTLEQCYKLLELNSRLLRIETSSRGRRKSDMRRLLELQFHRSIIKDCIIELLTKSQSERKVA